jgi:hypothetical protein
VLWSVGGSGEGGLPLRLGVRDGNTNDCVDVPEAIEECLALGLGSVQGIVADSKAYSQRTLGLCLEHQVGLVTLVPRTCAMRQELEAWGQRQTSLPLLVDKPGKRRQDAPVGGMGAVWIARSKSNTAMGTWRWRQCAWW